MTYKQTYGMACGIRIWTKVYNIGEKFVRIVLQFEVILVSMTYKQTYGMACDIRIWTKVYNIGEKFCEKSQ